MYCKLFSSIADSSLMQEAIPTRYVFIMLLTLADREGCVEGTDPALARKMNVPLATFKAALKRLMLPDPDSNSDKLEGRRIVASDLGGYLVVNYTAYRSLKDNEARKQYKREWEQAKRERVKTVDTFSPQCVHKRTDNDTECPQGVHTWTLENSAGQKVSTLTHTDTETHTHAGACVRAGACAEPDPNSWPRPDSGKEVAPPALAECGPPSLAEWHAFCAMPSVGIPREKAEEEFWNAQRQGWEKIRDWKAHARFVRTMREKNRGRPGAGSATGSREISVFAQKRALEEQLASHPGNPDSTACSNPTPEQRADFKKLREKISGLSRVIAQQGKE